VADPYFPHRPGSSLDGLRNLQVTGQCTVCGTQFLMAASGSQLSLSLSFWNKLLQSPSWVKLEHTPGAPSSYRHQVSPPSLGQ
jgi:hypothetical protein